MESTTNSKEKPWKFEFSETVSNACMQAFEGVTKTSLVANILMMPPAILRVSRAIEGMERRVWGAMKQVPKPPSSGKK